MSAPHILIAGAGIGGLTAALALARRGIAVTIVEKRTGFGELGAGLQISPNAGRVLDGLDLQLPLKRHAVFAQKLVVRRWRSGAPLVEMAMSADHETFRLFKRSDLHMALLDATRSMPNIRMMVGRGVSEVTSSADGVTAIVLGESGQSETITGLAIIGADGLWSRLRQLMGDRSPPLFTGYEAWRALGPAPDKAAGLVTLHLGRDHHMVHYPVAGGRETNLVIVRRAREAREGWSRSGDYAQLAPELDNANPALRSIATRAAGWQVWSLFDRKPAPMAKDRIALLGDAAHPVLPFLAQGAALAIEDAAVLARLLASHLEREGGAGVPAALAAYAKARAQRVARVQETSRANGRAYHLASPWSLGRDLVMKRLGPDGMRRRHDWVYGWRDES